jgi:ArsR family transcriptional regulator
MDCYEQQARVLRALSHPIRLRIAEILAQEEACVCHVEARLGLPQAYVSQQLGVLRSAGLLTERRVGTFVHYRLSDPALAEFLQALRALTGASAPSLPALAPADCGCPRCKLSPEVTAR